MLQHRISLLHLAAVALALAACCVHARSSSLHAWDNNGRQAAVANLQRREYSFHTEPPRRRRSSANAAVPWLPLATGLRGGGKGGAAVAADVPRGGSAGPMATGVRRSAMICGLFSLSYACSVLFNVNNKRALLLVPLPWTYAALNLLIGAAVAVVSWSVKIAPWPRITRQDVGALVPMGFLHAVSHLTVVLGLGAGAVSFLQTVKASEACFTALLSYLFLGQTLPVPVYLTLLPVVVGVALTCCGQGIRFSWLALLSALVSNLSNALRNVLIVKNIGPAAARRRRRHHHRHNEPRATSSFLRPATTSGVTATDAFVNNPIARKIRSAAALANTRAGGAAAAAASAGKGGRSGLADLAPGDTYRLLTVVGAALLVPAAAYFERDSWPRLWRGATDACAALVRRGGGEALRSGAGAAAAAAAAAGAAGGGAVSSSGAAAAASTAAEAAAAAVAARGDWAEAFRRAMLSGVCFNLFYDLTFRLLGQLHPVTHAVGNTIKRIVVIGAGAFVFGGDLGGARGALGSGLAVAGVLGYSLAKAWCKPTKGWRGERSTE